jgi:predicted metal-dependent peptidase
MVMKTQGNKKWQKNRESIQMAVNCLYSFPLFDELTSLAIIKHDKELPQSCWAQIHQTTNNGYAAAEIYCNYRHNLAVGEWEYVLGLALLHIGLNHVQPEYDTPDGRVACELYARNYLRQLGVGRKPAHLRDFPKDAALPLRDERTLKAFLIDQDLTYTYQHLGIGGKEPSWIIDADITELDPKLMRIRENTFVEGLKESVKKAVEEATDVIKTLQEVSELSPKITEANQWVVSSFPLLSALASSFTIIEDEAVCKSMQIDIAAVNPELKELYINPSPRWSFDVEEWTFILLHEFLHVGLRHDIRQQGRDAYFWNVACDYVINGWLVEMGVGKLPQVGMLYDVELKGRGAEDIYDELVKNLRWQRRLAKTQMPRGFKQSDIIKDKPVSWWSKGEGMSLDEFYRSCLMQGLDYTQQAGRGILPAGLVEEIKAINQRTIPWDVQLTKWLDEFFPAIERRRTYSRMSRRQSATPDIARPLWHSPEDEDQTRTFGVILDTSGSMSRKELAMALGAISSYAQSREVRRVRLVYCDAAPYDAGYIEAEGLLDRVEIKGRGGTVLQPAINLLQKAEDFPSRGPLLIITDGGIEDRLTVRMEHAYLMAEGLRLPFKTPSPIFHFSE